MKKIMPLVVLVVIACLSQGCVTMARGTTQDIVITSTPSGATVEITGPQPPNEVVEISGGTAYIEQKAEWMARGETPVEIKLRRDQEYTVKVYKDGFQPQEIQIQSTLSAWFWLDFFIVPIVGPMMDLMSGAAYDLEPGIIRVTLSRR